MIRRILYLCGAAVLALVLASGLAAATAGSDVRVSTHDLITTDAFASSVGGPPDVLQQNEPSIALHPANASLLAVGMNDVRTLGVSNDAWQGLAVSNNGGATYTESLVPGYPGDTSAAGLASPIRGNGAASDPWLGFDNFNNLFFAFIAFQRTPPGQPLNTTANALAVAKYAVNPATGAVSYVKTVVVERGTVGLGQQEDKEALAVDNNPSSPFNGSVYICWARFTGSQNHLTVVYSRDHGETWATSSFIGPQSTINNMQGCNLAVQPDGDVYVGYRTFDNNSLVSNPNDSAIFVARSAMVRRRSRRRCGWLHSSTTARTRPVRRPSSAPSPTSRWRPTQPASTSPGRAETAATGATSSSAGRRRTVPPGKRRSFRTMSARAIS